MKTIPVSFIFLILISIVLPVNTFGQNEGRTTESFNKNWKYLPGDLPGAEKPSFDDAGWRSLNVPHDWSIEGEFNEKNPATPGGGALPGGIGWYRKNFRLNMDKKFFINCWQAYFENGYHRSDWERGCIIENDN